MSLSSSCFTNFFSGVIGETDPDPTRSTEKSTRGPRIETCSTTFMILATTIQATLKALTGCSKASPRFSLSQSFWCLPLGSLTKVITDYLFTIERN